MTQNHRQALQQFGVEALTAVDVVHVGSHGVQLARQLRRAAALFFHYFLYVTPVRLLTETRTVQHPLVYVLSINRF